MSAFGPYVKEIELDFEIGLDDEKFFLIHGATGSGKTTILDAICYALYGEDFGGKNGRRGSIMRSEQAYFFPARQNLSNRAQSSLRACEISRRRLD